MKKYTQIFIVFITYTLLFSACKDSYLEEEMYGPSNVPLVNRVNATYVPLKDWYGKEMGYDFTDVGTDLFTWGREHDNSEMMRYEPEFDAENPRACIIWANIYKALASCNSAISFLNEKDADASEEELKRWESEVRVLRAHYYWQIVETWGPVHFSRSPTTTAQYEANSTPIDTFYTQIIKDLDFAVENLNETDNIDANNYGRITKDIALAFRARMHLTMGHYQKALEDADAVISTGNYTLTDDYINFWSVENSENNSEAIWALNYSYEYTSSMNINDDDIIEFCKTSGDVYHTETFNGVTGTQNGGGGFWGQIYFTMEYDKVPGMVRANYNRPFRRFITTRALLDMYDDTDERYEGTFRLVFNANKPDDSRIPKWPCYEEDSSIYMPDGVAEGDPIFLADPEYLQGDTALLITNRVIDKSLLVTNGVHKIHRYGHYIVLDREDVFTPDGTPTDKEGAQIYKGVNLNRQIYIGLKKFSDPSLPCTGVEGSVRSGRDAMIIRIAEIYLIAAEAAYNLNGSGNLGDAYAYLLELANNRASDNNGAALLSNYGIASANDITNLFILDERAREFAGEQLRWFDLKRMDRNNADFDMVDYIKSKNPDAVLMSDYHKFRPIPQTQIDAMRNPEVFNALNSGYN